jgi:hypothetical protein
MKCLIKTLLLTAAMAFLGGCAALDESSDTQPATTPVTFNYTPLQFRVKLGYTVNFTYTPKDQSDAADYVIAEFEKHLEADGNSGYGYQLAEGETPDLTINITVNSDTSNNKSMHVQVYASGSNVPAGTSTDGKTYPYTVAFDSTATYRDPDQMIDDTADQLNKYVSSGWWQTINE